MTFYAVAITERHVVIACDDMITLLSEDGSKTEQQWRGKKVWRVNDAMVVLGSGAVQFIESVAHGLSTGLASAIALEELTGALPAYSRFLEGKYAAFRAITNPNHHQVTTLSIAGVSTTGVPYVAAAHSPEFGFTVYGNDGACVTSALSEDQEPIIERFLIDTGELLEGASEDRKVDMLSKALVELTLRMAATDEFVSTTGHVAILGVSGPRFEEFGIGKV